MSARVRVFPFAALLALAVGVAQARESDGSLGGFICVRPPAPDCVEARGTYAKPADLSACQSEVEKFVNATAAYRDCLQGQITSAIRRVNAVVDSFRCQSGRGPCPSPSAPTNSVNWPAGAK